MYAPREVYDQIVDQLLSGNVRAAAGGQWLNLGQSTLRDRAGSRTDQGYEFKFQSGAYTITAVITNRYFALSSKSGTPEWAALQTARAEVDVAITNLYLLGTYLGVKTKEYSPPSENYPNVQICWDNWDTNQDRLLLAIELLIIRASMNGIK